MFNIAAPKDDRRPAVADLDPFGMVIKRQVLYPADG